MSWGRLFFIIEGRIGRRHFWLAQLVMFGVSLPFGFLDLAASAGSGTPVNLFSSLARLMLLYPQVVVFAKRLHDLDRSGWWQVAPLGVILAAGLIAIAMEGQGSDASLFVGMLLAVLIGLAGFAGYAWIAFFPGTAGANRFGEPNSGVRKVEPVAEVFS